MLDPIAERDCTIRPSLKREWCCYASRPALQLATFCSGESAAILSKMAERIGSCKDCIFLLGISPLCTWEHHKLGWAVLYKSSSQYFRFHAFTPRIQRRIV